MSNLIILDDQNPQDDRATPPKLELSTPEVEEKFQKKIKSLKLEDKEKETAEIAQDLGLPYINLTKLAILPDAIAVIPEEKSKATQTICFIKQDDDLKFAAVDPNKQEVKDLVKEFEEKAYKVGLYLITPHSFEKGFYFYKTVPKVLEIRRGITIGQKELDQFRGQFTSFEELSKKIRKISVSDLVAFLVATAIESRASDIHLEAEEKGIMVRYRIDGILHEVVDLPKEIWHKLDSRIKLIAGLKLNIENRPQDGAFSIILDNDKIDVRTSTIPTNYGESIVMRLLMSSATSIQFDDLGLRGKAFADLDKEVKKPNGMIITTGPTGSGKTTTLYAILNRLNTPETKIITLEDPVEYKLKGINQSQIDTYANYTFANGLRSIMRQDPDIIMVGEIRDLETAETAINAALTGHLVVSTIHTNSAAATIPRFLAMEVKPFLLAPSLNAMIGQRLVRRICQDCKVEDEVDSRTMSEIIKILSAISPESGEKNRIKDINNLKFYKGKGCDKCKNIGYKGRIGIYEIMAMTEEIEKIILSGQVSEYQMQDVAVKNGMVTMVQDGLLKALDGITTVAEIFRVAE